MYARVFNSQLVVGKTDEAAAIWREKVAPIAKQSKGFKGACVMGDRETGKGLIMTLWESKEDSDAMNAQLAQTQDLFTGLLMGRPMPETYEVNFHL